MPQTMLEKDILHYPQLDTILRMEDFIRENSGEYKKKALWENLPKKTIYQTFCVIFDYLLESGKIAQDREGHIVWINLLVKIKSDTVKRWCGRCPR